MTIGKYVADFINLYDNIKIDINHVEEGSDKYGLYKSPSRDIYRKVDGSTTITEYFQFYASQNSISEDERMEDDEWLEAFVYWVDDYPLLNEYPDVSSEDTRTVTNIEAGGSPTPFRDDNNGIMYQIAISITYEREV